VHGPCEVVSVKLCLSGQPRQKTVYVRPVDLKKFSSSDSPEHVLSSLPKMQKDLLSDSAIGEDSKEAQTNLRWMLDIKLPGIIKTNRREMCMAGCNGMYSEVTHVCRQCCNYLCRFCAAEHLSSDESMCHQIVTWLLFFCIRIRTQSVCIFFLPLLFLPQTHDNKTCIFHFPPGHLFTVHVIYLQYVGRLEHALC